ncbi:MaoC family dehydratase [Pseudohoeflea coraliihabitans]|uniref:MaoC family dehydratase n=1 Tax=Pseudohoeflea coraliihabitans TaxID=2860393 RepID=A0ABS6WJI9_9HYPH|nr:MaoC family dehydratase [Pseudohoeflea sp. DP4N28-3]MBW3096112.1 MaoC family dehydratase [Pseudohoeflea sp. DP4N28-3]
MTSEKHDDPHYRVGARAELGNYLFTAEEIIAFAQKFDPQPFHVDAEAAEKSFLGGLCASGWHTAAVWMKLNVAAMGKRIAERKAAGLPNYTLGPSPGIRNLRWSRPVYAGDTISFAQQLVRIRPSRGQPGWSILEALAEAHNATSGERVMSFDSAVLIQVPPQLHDGNEPQAPGPDRP